LKALPGRDKLGVLFRFGGVTDQQLPVVRGGRDRKRIAIGSNPAHSRRSFTGFPKITPRSGVWVMRGETLGKKISSRLGMYWFHI
jgi:hypothetical protein